MIYLGADHAGFELKEQVKKYLDDHKIEYQDLGAHSYDKADDYPDFGFPVAEAVARAEVGPPRQNEEVSAKTSLDNLGDDTKNKLIEVRPQLNEGILACESAGGMTILANKVKRVRAVECASASEASHAREHNNANVLVLSSMAIPSQQQLHEVLDAWFANKWTNVDRHARRIDKISRYEEEHWKE